ncbi:ATP-binding protein [Sorangium sp. So ce1099]|uniref:ATP-binding protein n=1 Tax=Sorangium sp. So ce1099 TaxID=3133331 RepID=UPI003F628481
MFDPETRRFRQVRALTEVSRELAMSWSACAIQEIVVSAARRLSGADRAVLLLNDEGERPVVRAALGLDPALLAGLRGRPLPSFDEGIARALPGAAHVVTAPLIAGDHVSGVLAIERATAITDEESWVLSALADHAAVALAAAGQEVSLELPAAAARRPAGKAARDDMAGSAVDLSERFRIESALRDREDRLRLATWAADVGTWSIDLETWIDTRDASLNRILGLEERETTQPVDDWMSRVHPEDRDAVRAMTDRCVLEQCVYDIVHRVLRADGAIRWVHDRGRILYDQEGGRPFLTGAVVDTTELKQLEEERADLLRREQQALAQSEKDRIRAEDANRMKDEFLATVSHELRTPLTAILGWARLIRDKDLGPERARQGMAAIERNAHAQAQIVDDILTVSRIITGKLRLNTVAVDLAAVVEAAVDTIAPTARAKEIELCVELGEGLGRVSGDPDRLQQVMWNLLSNAVKFTPKRGRVTVRVERSDSQVAIVVMDNGKGIAREFLPYVFDRFRQGDSSPTRAHGGLGLGLAIVRHLVELHGGTVEAESHGEGCGATFTVALPLQAAPGAAREGPPPAPQHAALEGGEPTPLSGLHVLLVEDEPDAREMVAFVLEETGARVTLAGSMSEAMAVLERQRPDVLVSDIGMPGESGYALIKHVRAAGREEIRGIPAVALTAYARIEDRRRALMAGFQQHVAKPIDPSGLVRVIADLAGRS